MLPNRIEHPNNIVGPLSNIAIIFVYSCLYLSRAYRRTGECGSHLDAAHEKSKPMPRWLNIVRTGPRIALYLIAHEAAQTEVVSVAVVLGSTSELES